MTPRISSTPPAHASHDELLVARFATDDVEPAELAQARTLTQSCPSCSTLYSDIRAIALSTRTELPQPRRTRDFRITAEQARQLRDPGLAGRLRRAFSAPSGILRPLAGATLSIGIALLVAGTVLPAPTARTEEAGAPGPQAASAGPAGSAADATATPVPALGAPTDERALAAGGEPTLGTELQAPTVQDQPSPAYGSDTGAAEATGAPFGSAQSGTRASGEGPPGATSAPGETPGPRPTTAAALGGREGSPAPGPSGASRPTSTAAPDDRRSLLIIAGLLLVGFAAGLVLRSVARRA